MVGSACRLVPSTAQVMGSAEPLKSVAVAVRSSQVPGRTSSLSVGEVISTLGSVASYAESLHDGGQRVDPALVAVDDAVKADPVVVGGVAQNRPDLAG